MQLNIPSDVCRWVNEHRGEKSRASFILLCLRNEMSRDVSNKQENKDDSRVVQDGEEIT